VTITLTWTSGLSEKHLHQFNVAKRTADDPPDLNKACDALALLAEELKDSRISNDVEDDDDNGNKVAELEQSLILVQLMLTKVNNII